MIILKFCTYKIDRYALISIFYFWKQPKNESVTLLVIKILNYRSYLSLKYQQTLKIVHMSS